MLQEVILKNTKLWIADPDLAYVQAFAEYVNLKKGYLFQVCACTDQTRMEQTPDGDETEILLITAKWYEAWKDVLQGKCVILLSEGNLPGKFTSYPTVYKYQSVETILREIMYYYSEQDNRELYPAGVRKDNRVIGVYSPADAEKYAKEHPEEQVTFLSVGFETTTPAGCLSVKAAKEDGLDNYSLLVANKTMPQAYEALKGSADVFLYPGHVNAITGTRLCEALTEEGVSGVVAGFTARELMTALAVSLVKFQEGKPFFVNCYPRVVTQDGSKEAQVLVDEMMEACDSEWRGLGVIPASGMKLRPEWQNFDARIKYQMPKIEGKPNPACRCGDVLQGKCKPSDCKVFGKGCTPQHPVGACMVSGEGACSAYYQYS